MNTFKSSLVALAVATVSSSVWAESVAITHATIYTATEQGVLTDASIVMNDGKIVAINPDNISADTVIDAAGKIVTPGLIGSMNQVGLVEVSAVAETRDAGEKDADMTFDPSLAFNPLSTLIPYSRKGGITRNVVAPQGGDSIFKGQTFISDMSGSFDSIVQADNAVFVALGSKSKGSRAFDLQQLLNKLSDRQKALAKAAEKAQKAKDKDKGEEKEPSREEQVLDDLLNGSKPLVIYAERASDLLQVIKLKQRFKLDVILSGAADAVVVADALAEAKIPVIVGAMRDLPVSFDALHTSLTSAAELSKAGVKVVLSVDGDAHNLYQLRYDAGNAVSYGMDKQQALAAVTANVADIFHMDAGKVAEGKAADLVLWSGDPFELNSHVDKMWIAGKQMTTASRHDALRHRYTAKSDMPRAYTK